MHKEEFHDEDSEELLVFKNIEKRIKKKPLLFSTKSKDDAVKRTKVEVELPSTFQYNVIYDSSGNPIAEIDFLSFVRNFTLKSSSRSVRIEQSIFDDDIKFKDNINIDNDIKFKIDDGVIENINSVNLDKELEIRIKSFYNSKVNLQDFFRKALLELELFTSDKIWNGKVKLKDLITSIEILPNIRITSPSLILFIKNTEITSRLFYKIYSRISNILNPKFVIDLLRINSKNAEVNSDYEIFRVKEFYKLYETTGDLSVLTCLNNKKRTLLHAKILFYMKRFLEGYLLIKDKHILKYKLEYYLNREKCIKDLKEDFFTYKHYLLYIWMISNNNRNDNADKNEYIESLYEKGVKIYNNIPCKLAHLRFSNKIMYEDIANQEIYYENYLKKRKYGEMSYKYLSKLKKKLVKKKENFDLLEQEMCFLENKECKMNNRYYYLWKYKVNRKTGKKDFEIVNGDSLIIMFIYGFDIQIIKAIQNICNFRDGFYWCRSRNIIDFENRLEESKRMFMYDQDF